VIVTLGQQNRPIKLLVDAAEICIHIAHGVTDIAEIMVQTLLHPLIVCGHLSRKLLAMLGQLSENLLAMLGHLSGNLLAMRRHLSRKLLVMLLKLSR